MEKRAEQESLAAAFDRHADEEGKILAQYRVLSEKLRDSALSVLIDHILTEEEMHHLLLKTMARWFREGRPDQGSGLPEAATRSELLKLTRTLMKHEQETVGSCRRLTSELSGDRREFLEALLDAVVLDSEKHHRLLTAVEKMLEGGQSR